MEEAENELARLRAENARLRAMIDRLERAGSAEPAPLAADTQIIQASASEATPAPVTTVLNPEHPKKPRRKRKRQSEQPKGSFLRECLAVLLVIGGSIAAYIGLLVLSILFSNGLQTFNFWSLLFGGLLFGPLILVIVGGIAVPIREQRAQQRRHAALPKKPRARPRRRITRKLRAVTTRKLDAE